MNDTNRKSSKLIVGIVLVVFGCGLLVWAIMGREANAPAGDAASVNPSSNQAADTDDQNTNSSESTAGEQTETATIAFTNDGFTPSTLTVKSGTVVTVKNESSDEVQFSSDDHPTHRLDPEINLSVLASGESASFTAETVGTHGFHNHLDDSKAGTLIVTE